MIWFLRMAFCGFYEGRSQRLQPCNFINIKCWAIHFELQVRPRSANGSRTARDPCNALTIDVLRLDQAFVQRWSFEHCIRLEDHLISLEVMKKLEVRTAQIPPAILQQLLLMQFETSDMQRLQALTAHEEVKRARLREAETCTCTAIQLWTVHSEASD